MEKEMKCVGKNLFNYRKKNGMTQTDISKKLNVSQARISKVEAGLAEFRASELFQVARLFRKPMEQFFE